MYIPEFVCGIAATLLAEAVLLVVWGLSINKKSDKKKEDKK